ncbi:MAG: TRAP transporter small permease [Candidatus Vecturithrix sp.]|jgi:TRAP-type C4-dicarboxylate transport system permease small subunit|nr:TRAP transporter small permease [Candidatus Vecturithrix sp.]
MFKIIKYLMDKLLEIGALLSISAMIVVVVIQVFSRFALPRTPPWTEEATRILFIYMVSFAGGLAVREKAFVNVDTFINYLPFKARQLLQIIIEAMIVVFMGIIVYHATFFVRIGAMQRSAALLFPMAYVFVGMFIVALFIGIYTLFDLVHDVQSFSKGGQQ